MKKLLPFILIIVLVTLACGASGVVNNPTSTPALTETPTYTETPIPTPTPIGPYAKISKDKAEFWFPLPDKQEWTWTVSTLLDGVPTPCVCDAGQWYSITDEYDWHVEIPTTDGKKYVIAFNYTYKDNGDSNDKKYSFQTQTGSFEELFKLMSNDIMIWSGDNGSTLDGATPDGDKGMTTSISNGGLLMVITNPEILKTLNDTKPPVLTFTSFVLEDGSQDSISPSYDGAPAASLPTNPASDATSAPVVESTATGADVAQSQFFTEEFDGDLKDWTVLPIRDKAESEKMNLSIQDSAYIFDLKGNPELGSLLFYDPQTYADVRIDAHVKNLNNDQGSISLICRYNGENWYEFYATTTGYYGLYYAYWKKGQTNARYQELYNGATDKMILGPGENDYSAVCNGSTLSFLINGTEVRSIEETTFKLKDAGKVGFGAFTAQQKTFDINIDSVKVSQP